MKNSDYWKKRFEQLEDAANKDASSLLHDIERQYSQAQKQIESQINSWYQRFAVNNEISMSEARKLLTSKELSELKWDIKEYIKYGEQNELNQLWMKQLENASARYHISRLEALKLQTQHSMEALFGNQLDEIDSLMKKVYTEGYYHTVYEVQKGFNIGWDIASIDQNRLEKIISKPWAVDGKNFSERIWGNKSKLVNELHTELTQMVITGSSPDGAISNIAKKLNTSKNNAGKLVMTESAYFASASQKDAFNDLDVERYEIVATLDSSTSEICQGLDGHVFEMKDFQPGITAPPFHVWCRTTTVPYFEDNYGERAARDEETGQTYYVPSNMKYKDWKESFVDGGSKTGLNKTTVPGTMKGTTIEEVQNNLDSLAEFKNKTDLTGVDLEVAQGIEESYNKVMTKYPQLKGQFSGLGIREKGASTYASCYVHSGSINVNTSYYGKLSKLAECYDGDVKVNWHPKGTDWKSIITHEIGHAVDGFLTKNGHGEMVGYNIKNASVKMRRQVLKELKMTKKDISNEVSRYASKNDAEFFAEAFAEYIDSPDPRPVAKKFGEILEEWMKGTVK